MPERSRAIFRPASPSMWLITSLLAVIAVCLLIEVGASTSIALAQANSSDTAGQTDTDRLLAVAGQLSRDTYGLYLVDLDNTTICVYQYLPGKRTGMTELCLMAARSFAFDRRLEEYNTKPSPREIKELIDQQHPIRNAASDN